MKPEEKKPVFSDAALSLINFVVRPPRVNDYDLSDLGFKKTTIGGKPCIRDDIEVLTAKGQKMQCSFYHFDEKVLLSF